ncbi:uncharacterized protein KD926_009482 [Aspergillus affinis]|uniref:uncharacterized protein n=1 Tax=Aspergillus affinis TaxID=1070780 RepID=UPI0022FF0E6C|nr:uncharacterized protein KD926_009482 [Aspergillus affinis]KAI9039339.1 hypothetical protein KD926_009482 [Aspergillus affinis]
MGTDRRFPSSLNFTKNQHDLPFDHSTSDFGESGVSKLLAKSHVHPNTLLGRLTDVAEGEWLWRNFLPREKMEWLADHCVQSQPVFPAFGYVAMVHEAAGAVTRGAAISLIEVQDLTIGHAIQISDSPPGTETLFILSGLKFGEGAIHADFACYGNLGGTMRRCASGRMRVVRGDPHPTSLPPRDSPMHGLTPVAVDSFYSFQDSLGYGNSGIFRGIKSLARKRNVASAVVAGPSKADRDTGHLLHPAVMESAGQVLTAAVGSPGDGRIYSLHVPTRIRKVIISLLSKDLATDDFLAVQATVTDTGPGFKGDIDFFDMNGNGILQVEGLHSLPLVAPTAQDDRLLFSDVVWGPLHPNAALTFPPSRESVSQFQDTSAKLKIDYLHLAQVVKQMVFRFPCMKILEIAGGTSTATQHVLDQIGTSFHSYTYAHTSQDALHQTETRYADCVDNFSCRPLDIGHDPLYQGFDKHSYSLVIVSHSLCSRSPSTALKNIRRLVKPGGYLVLMEVTDVNSIYYSTFSHLEMFTQAGDDGCRLPLFEHAQWNLLLREVGFSGVDTMGIPSGLHSVFVSQAISDTVSILRDPLPFERHVAQSEGLVIIGGASGYTSTLVAELERHLRPHFTKVTQASSLRTLEVPQLRRVAVLALAELDSECFRDLTAATLQSLQALFKIAGKVLWVTPGPYSKSPYHSMVQGLLRCVAMENTEQQYQQMSVDAVDAVNPKKLASIFMQLVQADLQNNYTLPECLWTTEPELWLKKDGVLHIPRILPVNAMNKRYMSNRRPIHDHVLHRQCKVKAVNVSNKIELITDTSAPALPDRPQIEVDYSTPVAIHIHGLGYLHVVIGRTLAGQQRVLALSTENASIVTVSSAWILPFPIEHGSSANVLAAMSAALVALHVLKCATPGTNILLHESNEVIRAALLSGASQFGIQPFFSTSRGSRSSSPDQIFIHPESPVHRLTQRLPVRLSVIAHLDSGSENLEGLLGKAILDDVRQLNMTNLVRPRPLVFGGRENGRDVVSTLDLAWKLARGAMQAGSVMELPVPFQRLSGTSIQPGDVGIVDWTTSDPVTVRECTASSQVSLSSNKTYLLVGMTDDFGRSVCEWMIARGARAVVFASQDPKLDQWWLDEMLRSGASVRALQMEVTDRNSVLRVAKTIEEEMLPVGGAVTGPMVLDEQLFADLSFNDIQRILAPNVQGSILGSILLLDELYSQDTLDFFILFGSSVGITGSPGQSAYAATTSFMSGLINRRRMQGLVGSIINPSGIYNVGSFDGLRAGFSTGLKDKLGMIPISEQDLHEVFAEGILAGRVDSARSPVILAGLGYVDPVLQPRTLWYPDPRFWGFIKMTHASEDIEQEETKKLASASDLDEAAGIIYVLLVAKVRRMLKLSSDNSLTSDSVLMELGIDSLVAGELRSWLIKKMAMDIPIFKILGGLSIGDIVRQKIASSSHLTWSKGFSQREGYYNDRRSGSYRSFPARNRVSSPLFDTPPTHRRYERWGPLSFAQSRYWSLTYSAEDKAAFNVTRLYRMKTAPQIEDLKTAIQTVSMRHQSLRTCYLAGNCEDCNPIQAVLPQSRLQLEEHEVDHENGAMREYEKLRNHVYNLNEGEVARVRLLSWRGTYFLLLGWHPIAMDGRSGNIFLEEIGLAYLKKPLPPFPRQYAEYVISQRASLEQGEMEDALSYWKSQFETIPKPFSLLSVPGMTGPRPARQVVQSEEASATVDAMTMNKIRAVCNRNHVLPLEFFLTVLRIFLARLTAADDICIGITDSNRSDSANRGILGHLQDFLPIRFRPRATDNAFSDFLGNTRDSIYEAQAHSQLPFGALLGELSGQRSITNSSLFQVLLIDGQSEGGDLPKLGDIDLLTEHFSPGQTSCDLTVLVKNADDGGSIVNFRLQKSYDGGHTASVISEDFVDLLRTFADDSDQTVDYQSIIHLVGSQTQLSRGPSPTARWPSTFSKPPRSSSALASVTSAITTRTLQILEHAATLRLEREEFMGVLKDPGRAYDGFERLPFIEWLDLAKRDYDFRWLVIYEDAMI